MASALLVPTILSVGLGGCATAMRPRLTHSDSVFASTRLTGITDDYWRFLQASKPQLAAAAAVVVPSLPDPTLDRAKKDAQFARAALAGLDAVVVDALMEDDYVSWLTMRWEMEMLSARPAFHWTDLGDLAPGRSALDRAAEILSSERIVNPGAGQRFLRLVASVGPLADSVRAEFTERATRGIRMPRLMQERAIRHVRSMITPPDSSPFAVPQIPDAAISPLDSAWHAQLLRDVGSVIVRDVNPALERLAAFLEAGLGQAPEAIGLWRYPGGAAHYAELLRFHSTLDVTPEVAHAFGVREVARLAALATVARHDAGLPVGRDSLWAALRADTTLWFDDRAALLDRAAGLYQRAMVRPDPLFQPSPSVGLALGLVRPDQERDAPISVYYPPTIARAIAEYRLNAVRLASRTLLTLPAMLMADLTPGLHHQQSIQRENAMLPAFRRLGAHTGFVAGWQQYVLEVADSVTTLTATERFGLRLRTLEAACGLVVDTGINGLGWSRGDALAFLRAWLPYGDADLEREYVVEAVEAPGTLAAAALGARELRGLRRWVERELGGRFSLAALHQELLRSGSLPLPVLGSHLERWIWERNNAAPGGR
jgi:uncharacterized protein (DUF885 family)